MSSNKKCISQFPITAFDLKLANSTMKDDWFLTGKTTCQEL